MKSVGKVFTGSGTFKIMSNGTQQPWTWRDEIAERVSRWWNSRGWRRRQKEFKRTETRYYGNGGTIHRSGHVDVEVSKEGKVVAVWFRCQALPFKQSEASIERVAEMMRMCASPIGELCGVEIKDPPH